MADRSRIGVITGLAAEAATLPEDDFWVAVSAANSSRAAQAADAMIADGATLLVSYGFAAGLNPRFGPGALLLPETVIAHEGEVETPDRGGVRDQLQRMTSFKRDDGQVPPPPPDEAYVPVDARVREALSRGLGMPVQGGAIAGVDRPLVRPDEKLALFAQTRAGAADMESHVGRPRGVSSGRAVRGAPCRQRSEQPHASARRCGRGHRRRPYRRPGGRGLAAAQPLGMLRHDDACARRGAGDAPVTPRWSPAGVPSLEPVTPPLRRGGSRAACPARAGRTCIGPAGPGSGRSRAPSAPWS